MDAAHTAIAAPIQNCCIRCFNFVSYTNSWREGEPVLRALEYRADLELEALDPVTRSRVKRITIAELERPDRRVPCQADAGGIAKRLEARLETTIVYLAGIDEHRHA